MPDEDRFLDPLAAVAQLVGEVLDAACALGEVVVLTNAVNTWVEKTVKRWMPSLTERFAGHGARPKIEVIYAQQYREQVARRSAQAAAHGSSRFCSPGKQDGSRQQSHQ